MLWLDAHLRFRNRLSPYLDGELSPSEAAALEAHLAGCDGCRRELDELHVVVAAVRSLPDLEAPRSFALSPRMLGRRPATPVVSAPPLALGMRLATAAVAVALAAVVIGDLSDTGGNGAGRNGGAELTAESRTTMEFDGEADAEEAGGGADAPAATDLEEQDDTRAGDEAAPAATPVPSGNLSGFCPTSGDQAGGGTSVATPAAGDPAGALCDETAMAGAEDSRAAEESAPAAEVPETASKLSDGDGDSTLRVLQIVLAGSLIALLGGVAFELISRRRRIA